jgi:hypothetical protein
MTAVTAPRVRRARHSSRCDLCSGWISTGQLITYRAGQWVHAPTTTSREDTMNETIAAVVDQLTNPPTNYSTVPAPSPTRRQ